MVLQFLVSLLVAVFLGLLVAQQDPKLVWSPEGPSTERVPTCRWITTSSNTIARLINSHSYSGLVLSVRGNN